MTKTIEGGYADGAIVYQQQYAYYQTREVERTVIDTRRGDDVVRADSAFQFLPVDTSVTPPAADASQASLFEEWGIDLGDFEQGGRIVGLDVRGGDGDDILFGGAFADRIDGGDGADIIVGGGGSDEIFGGPANDELLGGRQQPTQAGYPYPKHTDSLTEAFRFEMATPQLVLPPPAGIPGVDLHGSDPIDLRNTFALHGSAPNERLSEFNLIGDFNGDQQDDFIVSGQNFSYILFGPVHLYAIENVAEYAEIVIDHAALGRPGEKSGDLNGDSLADLVFSRYEAPQTVITAVFGKDTVATGQPWPREWNRLFVDAFLDDQNSMTLQVNSAQLSSEELSLQIAHVSDTRQADLILTSSKAELSPVTNVDSSFSGYTDLNDAVEFNGALYFGAKANNLTTAGLYKYDGSSLAIVSGTAGFNPANLLVLNETLYFLSGGNMYRMSAQSGGIEQVNNLTDIDQMHLFHSVILYTRFSNDLAYTFSGTTTQYEFDATDMADFTVVEDRIYFTAGPIADRDLYYWDGRDDMGTRKNAFKIEVNPYGSANPGSLTEWNGVLYFAAEHRETGNELWRVPASTNTPELVANIIPDPPVGDGPASSSFPRQLFPFKEHLYLTAQVGSEGRELWRYDPATNSAELYADLLQDGSSDPQLFAEWNGYLYFGARDAIDPGGENEPRYLWRTDGASGVELVDTSVGLSSRTNGIIFNDQLYTNKFEASPNVSGSGIWKLNPQHRTYVLQDLEPGSELEHRQDGSSDLSIAVTFVGNLDILPSESRLTATDSGDVNGDGLRDLSFSGTDGLHLVLGSPNWTDLEIGSSSQIISLATRAPFTVGDINRDGYDEVAVQVSSKLEFYSGSASFTDIAKNIEITVGDDPVSAATGDFNGDGQVDLAIGTIHANTVQVFWSIEDKASQLELADADITLTHPDSDFGTLSRTPGLDLNQDGLSDYVIGAGLQDTSFGVDSGSVYAIYGGRPIIDMLPADFIDLSNLSIPGSGSFLADRGTGATIRFADGDQVFSLPAGEQRWFRFSTLGDGKGGNSIVFDISAGDVVADLIDIQGIVLASGLRAVDLRAVEAGTYYLRVFEKAGAAASFAIEVNAPIRGQTHESSTLPDRDVIHGGDGDDWVVGNNDMDRLFGGSGADTFSGEPVEIRDRDVADTAGSQPAVNVSELSYVDFARSLDPKIEIPDPGLRAAVAESLGLPVSAGPSDASIVHQDFRASQLASIVNLDASQRYIDDLTGIEHLVNLQSLNLSGNRLGQFNEDAVDRSGQGRHGTYGAGTAAPTPAIEDGHRVLAFDGTDVVIVDDAPELDPGTGAFSASAWIKVDNAAHRQDILGKFETQAETYTGWVLRLSQSAGDRKLHLILSQGNSSNSRIDIRGESALSDNQWYHVAFSYNGNGSTSGVTLYVDGKPESGTGTGNAVGAVRTTVPMAIGSTGGVSNQPAIPFAGSMREVTVWNRALADTDLTSLMQAMLSDTTSLAGHWRLNDAAGSVMPLEQIMPRRSTSGPLSGEQVGLSHLQSLRLDGNSDLFNITMLADIPDLRELQLVDTQVAVTNVAGDPTTATLAELKALEILTWPSPAASRNLVSDENNNDSRDDGVHVVASNNEYYPELVRNVAPTISNEPDLNRANGNEGIREGQALSLRPKDVELGSCELLVDDIVVDELRVDDARTADLNNLSVQASITDAHGTTKNLTPSSLQFDGVDDFLTTPLQLDQSERSSGATLEAWVKPSNSANPFEFVFYTSDFNDNDWALFHNGTNWLLWNGESNIVVDTGKAVDIDQWQHVAAIFDPAYGGVRFIKNDESEFQQQGLGFDESTVALEIGRNRFLQARYFEGLIDEVRVWNRPLSREEVVAQRNQQLASSTPNLIADWSFDEGLGDVLRDSTTSSQDLRLSESGPQWSTMVPDVGSDPSVVVIPNEGIYTLNITVSDGDGGHVSTQSDFTAANVTPTIAGLQDRDAVAGENISFTPDVSDPGKNDPLSYRWLVRSNNSDEVRSSEQAILQFTPQFSGIYEVQLTVTDPAGDSDSQTATVTVKPSPRIAILGEPDELQEGQLIRLSAAGSSPLSPIADRVYAWTVRDELGQLVESGSQQEMEFVPTNDGTYTFELTITDTVVGGAPLSSSTSIHQVILNVLPTVELETFGNLVEGNEITMTAIIADPGSDDQLQVDWTITSEGEVVASGVGEAFDFTPSKDGHYDVLLEVRDSTGGGPVTAAKKLTILNSPPIVDAGDDLTVSEAHIVTLTGNFIEANAQEGPFRVTWDFGDGTEPVIGAQANFGALPAQTHAYANSGVYTVTLTVTDAQGTAGSDQVQVTVNNTAPIQLTLDAKDQGIRGEAWTLSGMTSSVLIGDNGETLSGTIEFGDGTGAALEIKPTGAENGLMHFDFSIDHVYSDSGDYEGKVVIFDDDGGEISQTFSTSIHADGDGVSDPDEDGASVDGDRNHDGLADRLQADVASLRNQNGDVFTVEATVEKNQSATLGSVAFVDQDTSGLPSGVTLPHGTIGFEVHGLPSDKAIDITILLPEDSEANSFYLFGRGNGSANEEWYLFDFDGRTGAERRDDRIILHFESGQRGDDGWLTDGVLKVVGAPAVSTEPPPTANAGTTYQVEEGSVLQLDAADSEGVGLSYQWDLDGDGVFGETGADAQFGDEVGVKPTFTAANLSGPMTARIAVLTTDANGKRDAQYSTITVLNVAPSFTLPENQTTLEGNLFTIDSLASVFDPGQIGGDTLGYQIDWGDGSSVEQGTFPPPVLSHIYADDGTYSLTISVEDSDGGITTETTTVSVSNQAPSLTLVGNQSVKEGSLLALSTIGQFEDAGFDNFNHLAGPTQEVFIYEIDWGDGSVDIGSAPITSSGRSGHPTIGTISGQHYYGDDGIYTVVVTLTDDDGGTANASFDVTVENVAPSLKPHSDVVATEGTLLELPRLGEFVDPGFDLLSHPDGPRFESFTYSIDWGDGTSMESGSALVDRYGLGGVPTLGSFSGNHTYADDGVYQVTAWISDDEGASHEITFQVEVENSAPNLHINTSPAGIEGQSIELVNLASFSDLGFDNPQGNQSESFEYRINWGDGSEVETQSAYITQTGASGILTTGILSGEHTYEDSGVYEASVTLFDDDGGVAYQRFWVEVSNSIPTLVDTTYSSIVGENESASFSVAVQSNQADNLTYHWDFGDGSTLVVGDGEVSHTFRQTGLFSVSVVVEEFDGDQIEASFLVLVIDPESYLVGGTSIPERVSGMTLGSATLDIDSSGVSFNITTEDERFEVVNGQLSFRQQNYASIDAIPPATTSFDVILTDTKDVNNQIYHTVRIPVLANPYPWQNSKQQFDVNTDGFVTPIDVLLVISELNVGDVSGNTSTLPETREFMLPLLDTSGDGFISAIDALLLISFLNTRRGEGEAHNSQAFEIPLDLKAQYRSVGKDEWSARAQIQLASKKDEDNDQKRCHKPTISSHKLGIVRFRRLT
ncbi:MAG: PKD domain-containing protein [Planctomycetota bacterium]